MRNQPDHPAVQHPLPAFWIARYPITNAQWQAWVVIASWLFWICVAIDGFTDYPRVAAFVEPYRPDEWWQVPVFWLARMVLLFFATLGFEFWMAVTSVVVFALVLRGLSLSSPRTRRGRTSRNDYHDEA